MTTKHLYSLDAVQATLLYSLQIGDSTLTVQCSKELIDSGESDLLWKTLTLAWLLQPPNHPNQYSRNDAFQKGDIHNFVESLVHSPHSLPSYEVKTFAPPPKSVIVSTKPIPWSTLPNNWSSDQAYTLWATIQSSLQKAHWERATRLTLPLLHSDFLAVVALLQALNQPKWAELLEATDYLPLAERILSHMFASLVAKKKQFPQKQSSQNQSMNTTIPVGRKGRTFHISPIALQIWQISTPPITDLMGCPILIGDQTVPYWKTIQEQFGFTVKKKELIFKDDTSLEIFYSTYFPDDIPDEWSNEERQKSHGIEIPESKEISNIWRPAFLLLR